MSDNLRVAITAAGAPQAATLIRHLRKAARGKVEITALDMNEDVVGRYLADRFVKIPAAGADQYDSEIVSFVKKYKPDAILNCSENDLTELARLKDTLEELGTRVLCSSHASLEVLTNKRTLYERLQVRSDIAVPEFRVATTLEEFEAAAKELGYPKNDVCFKPPVSKGSRGFRIMTERYSRLDLLLNHKPIAKYIPFDEMAALFRNGEPFPELLVMEVADGTEHDVMSLAHGGEALLTSVKTRESARWGVIDRGELVDREDIRNMAESVVDEFDLSFNVYMQFIGGKLIEASNRTSTYIFQEDLCEPWEAIRLAVGDCGKDEVRQKQESLKCGRRMIRYMDQIFYDPDEDFEY